MRAWQIPRYFGRHERTYSAVGAVGYQYDPVINGNAWAYPVMIYATKPEIGLTWDNSPQVKLWLGGRR